MGKETQRDRETKRIIICVCDCGLVCVHNIYVCVNEQVEASGAMSGSLADEYHSTGVTRCPVSVTLMGFLLGDPAYIGIIQ